VLYKTYALFLGLLVLLAFAAWKLNRWRVWSLGFDGLFKHQELTLLQEFLNIGADKQLTSNEINDIVGVREKGLENQRRIRTAIISQINNKIEQRYGIEQAIERTDHPEDKRLKLYHLKKKAYLVLGKVKDA
jgi:hypothetical protein